MKKIRKRSFFYLLLFSFCAKVNNVNGQGSDSTVAHLSQLSLEELMKIEITTASKKAEKVGEVPASTIIITRRDIEKYGYSTLEEILANVPGMYAIDNYQFFGAPNFGIRGSYSDGFFKEMIIMVNGVNQVDDIANSYQLNHINVPVNSIDRIEIVRGPMAVIYGNGAFFGAINIITNETEKPQSMVSAKYGSLNTYEVFTRVSVKENKVRFTLNAGLLGTDGIKAKWKDMVSDTSIIAKSYNQGGWNLPSVEADSKGQLADQRKYFNFSGGYKGFSCDLGITHAQKGVVDFFPGVGSGIITNKTFANATLQYKKEFTEKFALQSRFAFFDFFYDADYDHYLPKNFGYNLGKSDAYEAEICAFIKPVKDLVITAGLYRRTIRDLKVIGSWNYFDISNLHSYVPHDQRVSTDAFFCNFDLKLFKKLKLTAGTRLENLARYDIALTFGRVTFPPDSLTINKQATFGSNKIYHSDRAALIWTINTNHFIKLLYGSAIRQPSTSDNTDKLFESTSAILSLEPARIQSSELNYNAVFSSIALIDLSVFHNNLDKLIQRENFVENGQIINISGNSGKLKTTGIDIGLKLNPTENLSLELNAAYQKTKNGIDSMKAIPVAYSPNFLGSGKVSYLFPHYITFSVIGRFIDAMEPGIDLTTGKRIGEKANSYYLFDANLRFDNLYRGLYISINAKNLLNAQIRYPTTKTSTWADRGTIGYPRILLFNVGFKF